MMTICGVGKIRQRGSIGPPTISTIFDHTRTAQFHPSQPPPPSIPLVAALGALLLYDEMMG